METQIYRHHEDIIYPKTWKPGEEIFVSALELVLASLTLSDSGEVERPQDVLMVMYFMNPDPDQKNIKNKSEPNPSL